MRILLIGTPNCGKTTLFNALTGARERTGNRSGVTVTVRQRRMRAADAILYDLPGIAHTQAESPDAKLALEAIERLQPKVLLLVADATNPKRSLSLLPLLRSYGLPIVLALNLMDEAERKGIRYDLNGFRRALGIPTVAVSAKKRKGLDTLVSVLLSEQNGYAGAATAIPVDRILKETVRIPPLKLHPIERWIMRPAVSILLLAATLLLLFCIVFDWAGPYLASGTERFLAYAVQMPLERLLNNSTVAPWMTELILDGIVQGGISLLSFLPQILLLYVLLALLEDSGCLARMAFVSDGLFARIGLDGRALVPLLLGFGCTVPAALSVRSMEREQDRRRILRALPCVPCAAKLPMLALLAEHLNSPHTGLLFAAVYGLSLSVGLLRLCTLPKGKKQGAAVLELPPFRMPTLRSVWETSVRQTGHFLQKAGLVLIVLSPLLWLLLHFDAGAHYTESVTRSAAYRFSERLVPLFGLQGWNAEQIVALLSGMAAKEASVSALLQFSEYQTDFSVTFGQAFSFLSFYVLCPPCIVATGCLKSEYGKGYGRCLLEQTAIAFSVSALIGALF